ncbi:MAG: homoserine kinase [Acidobacteria bacterium]|nr:homoserine kinase [Acidobacteriota bacterium]
MRPSSPINVSPFCASDSLIMAGTRTVTMQLERTLEGTEISIPASIANLGPGLDTLAVAVQLYLRVRLCKMSSVGTNDLKFDFVGHTLDGENLIERAFRFLAMKDSTDFPSMRLEVRSEIPIRAGLGSSSAAIVAGLELYQRIAGSRSLRESLAVAAYLEGHPDNVSAALLGGLTGSCQLADGTVSALSCRWPDEIRFIVATPETQLQTEASRRVLPETICRADAIFNLQRVVLLLQSLQSADYSYLREALRDRWHQPYRQPLVPGLEEALALEHPDLLGVCLSGSGPSVVALAARNFSAIEELLLNSYAALGIPCHVRTLCAHQVGGQVSGGQTRCS